MSIARRRTLLWTLSVATLAVYLCAPGAWPRWIVERLDHCPELGCDFVHHYIPQARQLRGELVFGWVYPPFSALVLQPLTVFGDAGALRIWMLLQAAAAVTLTLACRAALRVCGRWTSWAGAIALVAPSLPLLHAIKWGQVSTFIAAGAVWALLRWRGRTAGIVLGVLAALKLYPLVYLAGALVRRDRRQLVWGAGTALVLGIFLPLVALGPQTTQRYFTAAFAVKWNFVGYLGGQALWPTLVRLFVTQRHAGVTPERHEPLLFSLGPVGTSSPAAVARTALLLLPALAVAAATARTLWRRAPRGGGEARAADAEVAAERRAPAGRAADMMLVLVATALCLAPGWHHYFAFLPAAMAVVLGRAPCGTRDVILVVAAWLATALPVFALAVYPTSYFHASQWGCTTWAALLVWWTLVRTPAPRHR
jgi:hypothetical protein